MHLQRLQNDATSILEAAKTVSLAFSSDPLITWLRPHAPPWGELCTASMKWQKRRVRKANCEGMVYRLNAKQTVPKSIEKMAMITTSEALNEDEGDKYGAIAILEPPDQHREAGIRVMFHRLKLWLLDRFKPHLDPGGSDPRVEIMMMAHEKNMEELQQRLWPRKPWYVEVVAVRPLHQGLGLGAQLMTAIKEIAGSDPIVLECTDIANIGFYQRHGFETVKEVRLQDFEDPQDRGITLSLMLRQ